MSLNCFKPLDNARRTSKELDRRISQWSNEYDKTIKLLLLGAGESGKTTIIKQMKILHVQGFKENERKEKAAEIRLNILEALQELIEIMKAMNKIDELENPENHSRLDYIRSLQKNNIEEFSEEFFDHAVALWSDQGLRDVFQQAHEFPMIDSARYFLEKIEEIRKPDYLPSNDDILHSRKRTTDIQKIEFKVEVPKKYGGSSQTFWMFDVGGQRGERNKWIQVFEGITAILFMVASSNFDSKIREDYETNTLEESLIVFETVWNSRFLRNSGFILFLNKQDLLQEKVNSGLSIGTYFKEYHQYQVTAKDGDAHDEYNRTRHFIKDKFMKITENPSEEEVRYEKDVYRKCKDRQCYWHFTTATDTNNVKKVFKDVHNMILIWNLEQITPN